MVTDNGVQRPCGQILKCKRRVKHPLAEHLKSFDPEAVRAPPQTLLTAYSPAQRGRTNDAVVVAFAESWLPYAIIDRKRFRGAFHVSIPAGVDRHVLSRGTQNLSEGGVRETAVGVSTSFCAWMGGPSCDSGTSTER